MNQENPRRPHLTREQRLPQSYKEVEKILNVVKKCEANVKTVLNNSKLRGAVLHKVSGLTFNVLKQTRMLDSIIEKIQILEKEPYLRKELAGILIHEMIFGNGLPGKSKPVETVLKYQADIEKAYNDLKFDERLLSNSISIPKYVRVNTLVITLPEVIEDLEYLGVNQIVFDVNISENEFYELVKSLQKNTFVLDYHFKDLLVFHGEENLATWSLYQKGHVFIQDKSSYIPAYVLSPPPGATVIDACAAPGMKTLHLTALMENNGVVYAFERDQQRFEILNKMLKSGHANICQTFCGDFNSVDPRDEKYSSVEYILLDPSCSGSGMVNRMDYITDTKESKNDSRIQKLAGFQIILLKHALLFPSVKRVVYSTCSMTETENEYVVHEVLNHFSHRFKLSPVLPDWSVRGSDDFEFGSHCLRASPDKCFTNGFFVAMFERLEDSEKQQHFEKKQHKCDKNNFHDEYKSNNEEETLGANFKIQPEEKESKNNTGAVIHTEIVAMPSKKKHKKKHKKEANYNVEDAQEETFINFESKKQIVEEERKNDTVIDNLTEVVEETPSKKKHKKKQKNDAISKIDEDAHDETFNANFKSKNQSEEKESKDDTAADNLTEVVEVMPSKKKHKKVAINNDEDAQEQFLNTNFENKNQFEEKESKNDISVNNLIEIVDVMPSKKKHKKKHKKDAINNEDAPEETFNTNFESKNQSVEEESKNFTEVVEEMSSKRKHKKKHNHDTINNVDEDAQEETFDNNFENKNQFVKEERKNDTAIDNFTEVVEETPSKSKHKKKHNNDTINNVDEDAFDNNFESKNQFVKDKRKYDTAIDNCTKVEEIPSKKKHKKKLKNDDTIYKVDENAHIKNIDVLNDDFTSSAKEIKPHKKHKSKHDKEYSKCNSESINLLAIHNLKSETNDNIQDTVFDNDIQEKSSKQKKKKRKHEDCKSDANTCLDNIKIPSHSIVDTDVTAKSNTNKKMNKNMLINDAYNNSSNVTLKSQSFNLEDSSLNEISPEKKVSRKEEVINSETRVELSNIDDDILTESVRKNGKKKHKRKQEIKECNNSFCETKVQNSNVENNTSAENVQTEDFSHKKKKKRKREHDIEEYNSSNCIQNSNAENDILTEISQEVEILHKKKKHKKNMI